MMIEADPNGERLTLSGRFDGEAVQALRKALQDSRAARIAIDFSGIAHFDEDALPFLTVNLVVAQRNGREVTVRGLRERHALVLKHYGYEQKGRQEQPFSD